MTDHDLGRLIIEPHHLWQRYLVGNLLFLWRVLKQQPALSANEAFVVEGAGAVVL